MSAHNFIDLTGQRFGRLTVIKRVANPYEKGAKWRCQCDCGNVTCVRSQSLRHGDTRSCGCLSREVSRIKAYKHGESNNRLHKAWYNMIERCEKPHHPAYSHYGGRGITVCQEWHDFSVFKVWALGNGYTESLTIDRIDTNGNYEPANCRWADRACQSQNRRPKQPIEYDGISMSVAQWGRTVGLSPNTLRYRLQHGWTTEEALTIPPGGKRNA